MRSIKANIISISGFATHEGEGSGIEKLFWRLRNEFWHPEIEHWYREWNHNQAEIAENIHNHSVPNAINIINTHSWGQGHGAYRLANELRKRGRRVAMNNAIDPVPFPMARSPISNVPGIRFLISGAAYVFSKWPNKSMTNVELVNVWRQENNWPRGRRWKDNEITKIVEQDVYGAEDSHIVHNTIDSHEPIHTDIVDLIRPILSEIV